MSFPKDFIWGAAAASFQIEGASQTDGKGLSVWDMMCRQEGKVWEGNTGDIACDHYNRYKEDVDLMSQLGLKAYRLSISWPRVIPEGVGKVNEKGLAFYDELVDSLLEKGIDPWITLFHWDYPYDLFCKGGWLNRDSADWFAEYTKVIVNKLSDRVSNWMTLNEPQCFIGLGHQTGEHAPGLKLGFSEVLLANHNALRAHGKAVKVIRQNATLKPKVGGAPVGVVKMPLTNSKEDVEIARKLMFSVNMKNCWNNSWFADPMIFGTYPKDGLELFKEEMPRIYEGDMEEICQPLDFYGANIYNGQTVKAGEDGEVEYCKSIDGAALTTMDWKVSPESIYWGTKFLYERYKLPIVVTENGMANTDWVNLDGKVHDPQRIDFMHRYIKEFEHAIDDGIEALGYFYWSIMDNFEWAEGYRKRFGLIHVDYETQKRTLKDSALWYKKLISDNGNDL